MWAAKGEGYRTSGATFQTCRAAAGRNGLHASHISSFHGNERNGGAAS